MRADDCYASAVSLGAAKHGHERCVCQVAGAIFIQARSGTDNKGVRTRLSSSEFPRFKANKLESKTVVIRIMIS